MSQQLFLHFLCHGIASGQGEESVIDRTGEYRSKEASDAQFGGPFIEHKFRQALSGRTR